MKKQNMNDENSQGTEIINSTKSNSLERIAVALETIAIWAEHEGRLIEENDNYAQ